MLDLRDDPVVTLETLRLSAQIEETRTGTRHTEVVLTPGQMRDVYVEMQNQVRFVAVESPSGDVVWSGMRLRCEEAA